MENTPSRLWVELDSQTQVLSRVRFLSRFGSPFIHISGPEGAGKSFLAQHLLDEQDPERVRCALLAGRKDQADTLVRSLLVHQLVDQAAYDDATPLAEFLPELAREGRRDLLIIVDDAQLLSDAMLMELWQLAGTSRQAGNRRCAVVLFGPAEGLAERIKALPAQQGVAQMTIDVPQLTRAEALTLMKAALVRAQRPAQDAEALLGTALRPGAVLAAAEKPLLPEPEPDLLPKPRAQRAKESRSRVGLISLAVLVLLALGAGTWVWLSEHSAPAKSTFTPGDRAASVSSQPLGGQSDASSAEKVLPKVDGAPLAPVPDVKGRLNSGEVEPIQQNEQVRLTEQSPVAQITAPAEPGETTQAQILPQTGKRVVLPGNVVDALVAAEQQVQQAATPTAPATTANAAEEAKPAATSTSDSATATSTAISPEQAAAAKRAESAKADNAKATAAKETAAKPASTKRRHSSRLSGDTELEKASPKHYTVQLSGSHSLKDAWHFVEKSGLASKLRVYETRRNGRAWYVVIMGNYPTVAQAKQAINTLPTAMKADQPWVKSYRQVQTELKRAQ